MTSLLLAGGAAVITRLRTATTAAPAESAANHADGATT
jgi:hypothetical protein